MRVLKNVFRIVRPTSLRLSRNYILFYSTWTWVCKIHHLHCTRFNGKSLLSDSKQMHTSYLSFLYTDRIFENQILHPKKQLKSPKTLKMSLKKSYICIFFHSFWKNLHMTENFYTDMSVVSVTNMRYEKEVEKDMQDMIDHHTL